MTAHALPHSRSRVVPIDSHADQSPLARGVARLQQILCGLRGHDTIVHFEHGRMSLQCVSCGHESPGWTVSPCDTPLPFTTRTSELRKIA